MRVLMFGWEFPPYNSGGLGVACYGLTRALVEEGAEVIFVLPRRMQVSMPGVKFIFADVDKSMDKRFVHDLQSAYTSSLAYDQIRKAHPELTNYSSSLFDEVAAYALKAREIARTEEFDLIHAHDWLTFLAGIEAKKMSGKPLVAHIHATEFDRTGFGQVNNNVYYVERYGMHLADQVIAVSGYTKGVVVDRYGVKHEKIDVVHNGIDPDDPVVRCDLDRVHRFKEAGKHIVLFVGRLTLQKGPDYFLQAAQKVLRYNKEVLFVISGSGDMERQVIEQAAYLGISDKVCFVGFLRGDDLSRLYKMADLVVMPSVSEPFGIVPLESLLNGTPVLISKQSGVSEVVRHALKVDFWDTDEMANQILSIVKYPTLRETLSQFGNAEARAQIWRKVAQKCMYIYDKVCQLVYK